MKIIDLKHDDFVNLEHRADGTDRVHVFDEDTILAVNTAWAAERPLLVRGEPGVGKSQLAEAVAKHTNRKFIPFVVDSKTESRDLLWRFDAVKRLADAQLLAAVGRGSNDEGGTAPERMRSIRESVQDELTESQYVQPGPLWWAFNWDSAKTQDEVSKGRSPYPAAPGNAANGCVVLIDEIDKAETDVPNGLLAALGEARFQPFGLDKPIRVVGKRPLVVVTTNEERSLPDAFVRRCIVHFIDIEDGTEEDLTRYLVARGQRHFPHVSKEVLEEAAKQLYGDRAKAKQQQLKPYPGQAEFLDLVRAVIGQEKKLDKQTELLKRISKFALKKNRGASS